MAEFPVQPRHLRALGAGELWQAYWIGTYAHSRSEWMQRARDARGRKLPMLMRTCIQRARESHKSLLRHLRQLQRSSTEPSRDLIAHAAANRRELMRAAVREDLTGRVNS